MRRLISLAVLMTLGLTGCGDKSSSLQVAPTASAEEFLRWSMDRYAALPTFQARVQVTMTGSMKGGEPQRRTVFYEQPNRFKVVSTASSGLSQTSVSNGSRMVEYDSTDPNARSFAAPATIADSESLQMRHPMVCGSLLYQFFAGSDNYEGLVKSGHMDIKFGPDVTSQGEKCRTVKFYGQQQYGNVEAIIGGKTGWVYQIKYDSEPMVSLMSDAASTEKLESSMKADAENMEPGPKREEAKAVLGVMSTLKGVALTKYDTIETYSHIETPAKIPSEIFDTTLPAGKSIGQEATIPKAKPPVSLGELAPDFEVTSLKDDKPVRLSSLRGRNVLVFFWATWSDPKRTSLKEIGRLAKVATPLGLEILVISKEDSTVVSKYLEANGDTLPTYFDKEGDASLVFGVRTLPTMALIDSDGKLRSFVIGVQDPKDIEGELAKIGLKLP